MITGVPAFGYITAPLHRVRAQGHFWHPPGVHFWYHGNSVGTPGWGGASNLKLVILPLKGPGSQCRKVPGGPGRPQPGTGSHPQWTKKEPKTEPFSA